LPCTQVFQFKIITEGYPSTCKVTSANMPWYAAEVRKNRRSESFLATTLLRCFYVIILCYDFSFLLLILMKLLNRFVTIISRAIINYNLYEMIIERVKSLVVISWYTSVEE